MRPPPVAPEFCEWTVADGYVLRGRLFRAPARKSAPVILYLHGIQSHGGWFEWSAGLLASRGFHVVLPDRRGSGLNTARGDVDSAERWLADLDDLCDWIQQQLNPSALDLVGVSWGGKLAAGWTLRRRPAVRRLLLVAPGIYPAVDLPRATKLRVALALLSGGSAFFEIPLSDPALFTQNPAGQVFIAADQKKLTHVTARFLWHSRRLERLVQHARPRSLRPPLTLLLAGRDRIIRNSPTAAWARRVCLSTPEIVDFPQDTHTLEFEAASAALAETLRHWAARGVGA